MGEKRPSLKRPWWNELGMPDRNLLDLAYRLIIWKLGLGKPKAQDPQKQGHYLVA